MAFTRISNSQINSRGATTLPNQPQISAAALKEEFDAPAKQIVAPAVNNLMDELETSTSAGNLGAVAPTGRTGSTVQSVLNSLSTDLGTAEAQSHAHPNKAVIDKFADDGTGLTYDGNPVGAVTSVNSQTGAVVLTASDVGALPSTTAIPTKTSDLTNDSGFITASSLPTKTSQLTNDSGFITSGDIPTIPTKTSDLTNDSNFVADASYVHTDNNYDATAKSIVDGATAAIAAKSTVAWNQIDTTGTKIAEITIDGVKTEVKATGGGNADAYKTIDAGGQSFVASGADTFKINAGSNVTITPLTGDKGIQISAAGGGTSTGDMLASVYDNDFTIKNASPTGNGIKDYVASAISGKVDTAGDGLAKEGTTIALDLGMLTGSNLTKAVSGKDIKDALDEKADTSDIPTPAEKTAWDAKVSESLLKSTVGWIGKNACLPTKLNLTFDMSATQFQAISGIVGFYGEINQNTDYTFSKEDGNRFRLALSTDIPAENVACTPVVVNEDLTEYTFNSGNYNYAYLYVNNADISYETAKPLLAKAEIKDRTFEPYHKSVSDVITDVYGVMAVEGVHQYIPFDKALMIKAMDYGTWNGNVFTVNGGTVTINPDDETVTIDGTFSETSEFRFFHRNNNSVRLPDGDYIISGGKTGLSIVAGCTRNGGYKMYTQNTGADAPFTILSTDGNTACSISISAGTYTNVKIEPLIRRAADTYTEHTCYAMTNRELTEVVTPDKTAFTDTKGTASVNTIVKTGNIVVADLRTNGLTTAAWESIATIPAGYRPANNVWFVANDMTGGTLIRCALNSDGTVTCPSAISNKEIYIHAFWSIV